MHIGVLFLSVAWIWVYLSKGSFEFSAIESFFLSEGNVWLFLLFLAGFGLKAGFLPLHSWLPQAHPAAPSHISGIMSGVIVKLGIYGIFRILFLLKQDYTVIGEIIIILSIATGIFGILNAAVHRDYKKMLAYCTIENIGIIGIGIGVGLMGIGVGNSVMAVLGFAGALLHVLNHSLFKSLLFFTAGSVYQQTHTRDMEKLGGLVRPMPQTAAFFLIGGMAIGGLPPFNGFVSEFLLYSSILTGIQSVGITYVAVMISSLAGIAFIGGISMLTFTKCFGTIFLGVPRTHLRQQAAEVPFGMRLPQYFIVFLMLVIGLFPQYFFAFVSDIVLSSFPAGTKDFPDQTSMLQNIAVIGKSGMLFVLVCIFVFIIRKMVSGKSSVTVGATWGCGYVASTSRMQYTGKSFSKSLGKLLNFVVLEKKKYKEIASQEIFPSERKYSSHYNDFFTVRIFNVLVQRLLFFLNYFQFIQNGKLQMYILYGIFFIALVFVWTIFNFI
jgi:formate hydrogenlyase subunit 3/multisubunit Na+/H+ antiporter MnhD subunit